MTLKADELLRRYACSNSPNYVMTTATPEKADGLKALHIAIEEIEKTIKSMGGVFQIQMAPKVVTATDEAELARQMERAEAENAEVAGDDDEEEENGEGDADVEAPSAEEGEDED